MDFALIHKERRHPGHFDPSSGVFPINGSEEMRLVGDVKGKGEPLVSLHFF
jgi:phosphoribosylpyrophosphate synthetase